MFLATSVGLSAGCGNSSVGSGAETGGGSASAGGVKKFLDDVNADLLKISTEASQADWVYSTYITQDTEALTARAEELQIEAIKKYAKEAARFEG